ncbi:Immunoglobulin omega chain [Labeo rohita]|nr:Immunoglobulin omega chain [Labeo rohita]
MKIIQLQFCEFFLHDIDVLICCEAAVTDLLTDLGSNVIINCDLDENENDVYWILLKTPDPPTVILRSFSTPTSPFHYNNTFRKKYSVQFKHRLVINNVTADELGAHLQNSATAPDYTLMTVTTFFTESVQITECYNHTVVEFIEQNQTQWQIIIIISSLMNGLLLILLIGLLNAFVGNRRSAEQSKLNTTASTAASYRTTSGPFTL